MIRARYVLLAIAIMLVPVPAAAGCFLVFCWQDHVRHRHKTHHPRHIARHHGGIIHKKARKPIISHEEPAQSERQQIAPIE